MRGPALLASLLASGRWQHPGDDVLRRALRAADYERDIRWATVLSGCARVIPFCAHAGMMA